MAAMARLNELVLLSRTGRFNELEKAAEKLAKQYPDFGHAWNFMGIAQLAMGSDALAALEKAAALLPADPTVNLNLALALIAHGERVRAEHYCRVAIALRPDYAKAHMNLGAILLDLGRMEEAIESSEKALALQPDYLAALTNLSAALGKVNRKMDSIRVARQALTISPDNAAAHLNLGQRLEDLGMVEEAEAHIRRALEIEPANLVGQSWLQFLCSYHPGHSGLDLLAQARRIGQLFTDAARPWQSWPNDPDPSRRLRLGFVSPDFRRQSVGLFVENVFAALHDMMGERIELHGYHVDAFPADDNTARIKSCCAGWTNVNHMSDSALAEQIRQDGIDILFDLSGHTGCNRLPMFAWKPAPVQVSWIGYLGTTGLPGMDYLIADECTLPASEEAHFSEKILRMPETYLCFRPPEEDCAIGELPAIRNGHVTFGSFNNPRKVSDEVLETWAEVLAAVPGSRLLCKYGGFSDESLRARFTSFFVKRGIAEDRLEFMGRVPHSEHLPTYNRVDIALDPFPYPGVTTSVEALWMGVPVLTLAGDSFISRQGAGLLQQAGLPEWAARSRQEYVAKAVGFAASLERLAQIRGSLRGTLQSTALLDSRRFAVQFESLVRGIWQTWCDSAR